MLMIVYEHSSTDFDSDDFSCYYGRFPRIDRMDEEKRRGGAYV